MAGVSVNDRTTAANLVASARTRRDVTQHELANAAGIPQTTVSMIESGQHQPSMAVVEQLVAAAGFTLDVRLVNTIRPSVLLARYRDRVMAALAGYPIAEIWVFGSVARGDDHVGSDLDLLVDLRPGATVIDILGLDEALSAILGCPVDIVTTTEIESNYPLKRSVDRHRRPLVA